MQGHYMVFATEGISSMRCVLHASDCTSHLHCLFVATLYPVQTLNMASYVCHALAVTFAERQNPNEAQQTVTEPGDFTRPNIAELDFC